MRRWVLFAIVLVASGGVGFWAYGVLFPSPEKVIRRQLLELARSASYDSNESALARLANAQKVIGFFSSDAEIRFDSPGHGQQSLDGRDEILQAIMAVKSAVKSIKVEFPDVVVRLVPGKNKALADVTVRGTVSGERDLYIQEMNFHLEKIEGRWLVKRVEPVKTLNALPPARLNNRNFVKS
jgi:hypothetical protein